MSTFKHSRQMRPRYESAPYRMHPSRREHIYGRIQPMNAARDTALVRCIGILIMLACTVYAIALWVKP